MKYKRLLSVINIMIFLLIIIVTEKSKLNDKTIEKFARYMKRYPKYYNNTAEIVKKSIPKKVTKPVIIDLGAGPGYLSKAIRTKSRPL